MVFAGAVLAGCGRGSPSAQPASTSAVTATTVPGRSYSSDLTTTDGYRYRIAVLVGLRSSTGSPACPAAASAGKAFVPVTLTVSNEAADKPAPFPPLRIEMISAPGAKPDKVLVRDPSGSCTFTPKVPQIAPGASAVFPGTTPALEEAAAPGTAGQIQVSVSESRFSLLAPVP